MKNILSILQLTIIIIFLAENCFAKIPNSLPYQAHSFNDLDVAKHLLDKGVKYFKFDASLANKQSCSLYSTWNASSTCINLPEYAQDICCIAMRGDASSEPNFYYPFNTSVQFVKMLSNHLKEHSSQISLLFVAIDFQFSFNFENSLAQKFMYDLASLMNEFPQLSVTTKGDYIFQYDRVCRFSQNSDLLTRPLSQTSCTSSRKHISDSRFFLQTGSVSYPYDSRDYKKRYRNFNTIFRQIDNLCKNGFPTWTNKYPEFPLIFWQPSNQLQIQQSLRKLFDPECQKKHNRTLNGIAFASNIDPQMFDINTRVTLSQQNSQKWHINKNKVFYQKVTKMKIAKILISQKGQGLVTYQQFVDGKNIRHVLSLYHLNQDQSMQLQKQIELNYQVQQIKGIEDRVIVVCRKMNQQNGIQFNALLLSLNSELQFQSSSQVSDFITSAALNGKFFFFKLASNPQVLQLFYTSAHLQKPQQYKLPILMSQQQIQTISSFHITYSSKSQEQPLIFLLGNEEGKKTWIAQIKNSSVHAKKTLTFGINAKMIQTENQSISIFLENSYTHGGLLMNNNGQNTCLYHKYQKLQPLATIPNLISAIKVSTHDLQSFLENIQDDIVTACHPRMTLSKYLNGANFEILPIWNRTIISTQYIPITKQDFIAAVFSGGTNFDRQLRNKSGYLLASTAPQSQISINQDVNLLQI